jgi:hypothetical protein
MSRLLLWLGFGGVSFVFALSFAGWGHGSYAPFVVFCAWGSLPWELLSSKGGDTVTALAFLGAPAAYLSCLFVASGYLVRRWGLRSYGLAPATHIVGVVLAAIYVEHGHLATRALIQISYFSSAALLIVFFAIDYWVLRSISERTDGDRKGTAPAQSP